MFPSGSGLRVKIFHVWRLDTIMRGTCDIHSIERQSLVVVNLVTLDVAVRVGLIQRLVGIGETREARSSVPLVRAPERVSVSALLPGGVDPTTLGSLDGSLCLRRVDRRLRSDSESFEYAGLSDPFNAADVEQFIQAGRVEPWASR